MYSRTMKLKLKLNLTLFLLLFFMLGEESFSLSDYKIKKICEKEIRKLTCINNLKEKRSNLNKGNLIEIPVIPYKK